MASVLMGFLVMNYRTGRGKQAFLQGVASCSLTFTTIYSRLVQDGSIVEHSQMICHVFDTTASLTQTVMSVKLQK